MSNNNNEKKTDALALIVKRGASQNHGNIIYHSREDCNTQFAGKV